MRRLSYIAMLLVLVITSCTGIDWHYGSGSYIELTLICNDSVLTKAGNNGNKDGQDRYNENYLDVVDLFFYPGANPDPDMNATYHIRLESGKRYSDVFRIEVDSGIINNQIFPSYTTPEIRKATVFAIVNYHGTLVENENNLTGTSMSALESIVVESNFVSATEQAPADFLMSGTAIINLQNRTQVMTATGAIDVSRYACKLTTGVKVADRVELSNGEVWVPMLEGMEIYLDNGVKTVALSGADPEPEYFSYYQGRKRFVSKDIDGHYSALVDMEGDYYNTYPMYMYPQSWKYGSTTGYDREPFLKLVVPWARLEEGGYSSTEKQLYYKIVMPDDTRPDCLRKFVRNNWYHLDIDVGILGAETDEAAVTIDPATCYIVYWQGSNIIEKEASIGNARYLSLERDSIILNNINSVEISYTTSHPVIIKSGSISVTRPYYGTKTSGNALGGTIRKANNDNLYPTGTYYLEYNLSQRQSLNQGVDWFDNTGTSIIFDHRINNDYTDATFDYSPYTITFSIVHEDRPDDTRYQKDIYIKQYPGLFIESLINSDETFVYWGKDSLGNKDNYNKKIHTSQYWGYVYIDNEQIVRPDIKYPYITDKENGEYYYLTKWKSWGIDHGDDPEEYRWRVVWYTGGSRDMFRIDVTVLPPRSDFVIGDPRTLEIDNLRNSDNNPDNDFSIAPALDPAEPVRSLKYYYPAENSDRTKNMMAPSFRFSSKCNGTEFDGYTMEQAIMRCATYQEDGFPAGRWRLPTQGEIRFVAMLSANGAFEPLFTNNQIYWSANGSVKVSSGSVVPQNDNNNPHRLSRCVYDSWYWGNEQQDNREQFVWGDRQR